jgi:hypothetical protein
MKSDKKLRSSFFSVGMNDVPSNNSPGMVEPFL